VQLRTTTCATATVTAGGVQSIGAGDGIMMTTVPPDVSVGVGVGVGLSLGFGVAIAPQHGVHATEILLVASSSAQVNAWLFFTTLNLETILSDELGNLFEDYSDAFSLCASDSCDNLFTLRLLGWYRLFT
jgi:hypothetical protein